MANVSLKASNVNNALKINTLKML